MSCDASCSSSDSKQSDGENMSIEVVTQVLNSKANDLERHMQEMVHREMDIIRREVKTEIEGIRKDVMSIEETSKVFEERLVQLEKFTEKQEFDRSVMGALHGKVFMCTSTLDQVVNTTTADGDKSQTTGACKQVHNVDNATSDDEMSVEPNESVITERSGGSGSKSKSKFSWQVNKRAEEFIRKFCRTNDYTRAEDSKKQCFQSGCENEMWPNETQWQIRVYYKTDSVCKAATQKRSLPKK